MKPFFLSCLLLLQHQIVAAGPPIWPSQYKISPWDTAKLTPADVVGPDGIVYPDFTGVGVTGGIPDINSPAIRSGYTVYDVTAYGANGGDAANDDTAVADALAAAVANSAAGNKSILYFPAGTFHLVAPIVIKQNNLVVDGAGPAATIIKLNPGQAATGTVGGLFTIAKDIVYLTYLHATVTAPRGSNTVTCDLNPATSGYSVGTWVRMFADTAATGTTMNARYSFPENGVSYTDPLYHFGRFFLAKVTAINGPAKTLTFDRTFTHDYYADEQPELRIHPVVEYSGMQDLTIETTSATVALAPAHFARTANCWLKNVTTIKAADWPMLTDAMVRCEIRDCDFQGTWSPINSGSRAYLGWTSGTDCLMENCSARDLRHMAIFQIANRCVIRNCTFTGQTIQSPQLHGRFPLENMVEGSTCSMTNTGGTGRGITGYAADPASSNVHGPNGPRNVFYNNRFTTGMASLSIQGTQEGLIIAYNRFLKNADDERRPAVWAADRSFDITLRGNIFQCLSTVPAINLEDPTCPGWNVTDNTFHGTNGSLWAGDSELNLHHNNRFLPEASAPALPTPEVASIYDWQRVNAATPRLLLAIPNRVVTDTGGTTTGRIVRVKSSTAADLTVSIAAGAAGLSVPATVTIPAGTNNATFTITGAAVSGGEKTVVLTATAAGLLADIENVQVLDQNVAQPNFGSGKFNTTPAGLPANWKAADFARVTTPGTSSYNAGTATWTLQGAGLESFTYDDTLARGGRRFTYQTLDGDGEIRARVATASADKQVGLMIADDEAPITEFIWVEATGRVLSSGNTYTADSGVDEYAAAGGRTVPVWLRLKRVGSVFTAYRSIVTNPVSEADWTVLATINFYFKDLAIDPDYKSRATLDDRMHYGMFINSGSATTLATATFTGVSVLGTLPPDPLAFVWNGGAGSWTSTSIPGWNRPAFPNVEDANANLAAATGNVTVGGSYTLGSLALGGTFAGRTLASSSGSLVFQRTSGDALIDLAATGVTLKPDFQLNDNLKLTTVVSSGSQTATLDSRVTGVGKLILENTGTTGGARFLLTNPANDFTGGIEIGANSLLRVSASGALGAGPVVRIATAGNGSFDFLTNSQTHTNDIDLGTASATLTSMSIAAGLTISLNGVLSGTMGSGNRINLSGGTLVLGGTLTNTWTGQVRSDTHGTIIADKVGALPGGFQFRTSVAENTISLLVGVTDTLTGPLTIEGLNTGTATSYLPRIGLKDGNNGTVTLASATAINLNQATRSITTDPSLEFHSGNGSGKLVVSSLITNNASPRHLRITGTGTVILDRAAGNTYSGITTVAGGILLAENNTGSATGSGAVVVSSAATLGGRGVIGGPVTLADGARMAFDLVSPAVSHDKLDVTNVLDLGPASSVTVTATSASRPGLYTLVTGVGNITGNLPTLQVPSGWNASLLISGSQLQLNVINPGFTPLEFWRWTHFMTLATDGNAGNGEDPDGDTITNLLEYAQGGNPNSASSAPKPEASVAAESIEFRFQGIADPALVYEVWGSNDLGDWGPTPIWSSTGIQNVAGPVVVTEPLSNGAARFFRLRVTVP